MDEGVSSPGYVRDLDSGGAVPFGFAVGRTPAAAGLWHALTGLGDGRYGVAVGHCADASRVGKTRARILTALIDSSDPAAALAGMSAPGVSAACAVIDRAAATLACGTVGDARIALAAPGQRGRALWSTAGATASAKIPAGGTVLLCTDGTPGVAASLAESACVAAHPDAAVGHLLDRITPSANPGLVAVLYRQAPDPLEVTLPAHPSSLAVLRSQLRPWLALAGVDAEPTADVLLAVGEAASNSSEHAVLTAPGPVDLTLRAALTGDRLRMTVSDNGSWKPAAQFPGHRGHGIKLITALVDTADLTTTENGTTVEMLKELRR